MIRQQVEARIAELEGLLSPLRAEYDQLQRVAATFAEDGPAADGAGPSFVDFSDRSRQAKVSSSAGAPRPSGGGSRAEQAVRLIEARPGITAAELAEEMGISRNYLYRVLPKLEQRGVVAKHERGYHQASAAH
jgi:CRP-like cAMP-binding protein